MTDEIGYAISYDKFVVAVSPKPTEMPFDVRANNVIVIGHDGDNGEHRSGLSTFMLGLRGMSSWPFIVHRPKVA